MKYDSPEGHLQQRREWCDQIWQNFATVVKYYKSLGNFWNGSFSIWPNFIPALVIFMLLGIFSLL